MAVDTVTEFASVQDIRTFIAENDFVVIDFTATWCGPCRMIGPVFEKLSALPENKNIKFAKVDVDQFGEIAQEYSVSAMPTFKFIQTKKAEGADPSALSKHVDEFVGANPGKLTEKIKEFSAKADAAAAQAGAAEGEAN